MTLYIIRGLAGSGKSTLAATLARPMLARHVEADMYFLDENGEYRFEPSKLKEAHQWCQAEVMAAMEKKIPVVVSNTFTQEWEVAPYRDMANAYGYRIQEIVCLNDYGSIHNVPADIMDRQRANMRATLEARYQA